MIHNKNKYDTKAVHTVKTMPKLVSGFTLIELLIVIAIIGILASVVLGSLNTARAKGTDAAIKSSLNNMRGQASIWYDDNSYVYAVVDEEYASSTCPTVIETNTNIFSDTKIFEGVSEAYNKAGGASLSRCVATEDTWAIAVQLKSSDGAGAEPDSWCVDSVGASRAYTYGTGEDVTNTIDGSDACK